MDRKVVFGRRLKELRTSKGLTQEEVAERLGLTWRYISIIERGKGNPTLDVVFGIADAVGVEPVALFAFPAPGWSRKRAQEEIEAMAKKADDKRLREILHLLRAREA